MNKLRKIKIVNKPWGREAWFAQVEGKYLGKVLLIKAGKRSSLHYHKTKEETMLVVAGKLDYMRQNKGQKSVGLHCQFSVGSIVHIPPGVKHSLGATADKDVMLFEVSTCHPKDSVRVFDYFGRKCHE